MLGSDGRFAQAGQNTWRDALRRVPNIGDARQRFPAQIFDKRVVDVVAAEAGIAIRSEHLEDAFIEFEDRDVKGAAAEVKDRDLRAILELIEAVGQRGGGGLVHDALHREAGEFTRRLGGMALRVVEIRGDGDDRSRDLGAEGALRIGPQLPQDKCGDFLGRIIAVADLDTHGAPFSPARV